jgi:hypothetical protein
MVNEFDGIIEGRRLQRDCYELVKSEKCWKSMVVYQNKATRLYIFALEVGTKISS